MSQSNEELQNEFTALARQIQLINRYSCIGFGRTKYDSPGCGDCRIVNLCSDLSMAPERIAAVQDIAKLPKFLTSIFSEIRELAAKRLEELEANDGCGEGTVCVVGRGIESMLYKVKAGRVDGSSEWEEEMEVPDEENPEAWCKQVIDDFNQLEQHRYGEAAHFRKFIALVEKTDRTLHSWVKLHGIDDVGGVLYECSSCHLFYTSRGLNNPPSAECYPKRVCTDCNKEFKSEVNLRRHMARKHGY